MDKTVLNFAIKAFAKSLKDYLPPEAIAKVYEQENVTPAITPPEVQLLSLAQKLSMGLDTLTTVDWKKQQDKRLSLIFEQLMQQARDGKFCYPLKTISPENIFPCKKERADTSDSLYTGFFEEFADNLGKLHHKDNPELWFENFESLVMSYTSAVPVAGGPDISLYDHCKISTAMAVALYAYHENKKTLSAQAIQDTSEKNKFLIVSGGISGIQNFILRGYGESRKYRSKLLRGRSFAVSLLTELAADMLCRKIGIPSVCIILNAAGRFSVLAPNIDKTRDAIAETERIINDWLIEVTYGETNITLSSQEASCDDFKGGNFLSLWEKIEEKKEEKKFQRIDLNQHGGFIGGYLDSFRDTFTPPLCPICGKRPSEYEKNDRASCRMCGDHIFLGKNLVKETRLAVVKKDVDLGKSESLLAPIFNEYQVAFLSQTKADHLSQNGQLLKYWDLSNAPDGDVAVRFINGYVPVCSDDDVDFWNSLSRKESEKEETVKAGVPQSFNLIAARAMKPKPDEKGDDKLQGVEALGVLKADVDDLGLLMACGLSRKKFTLARLSTLSRQLHYYFAVFLPHFLKNGETATRFENVYTVFAGGDDLFLIGPWNQIIALSVELRQKFATYVCNSKVHFSAGITLHKPHTPVDLMAEAAEEELEKSKSEGKDRLTLFSETVPWNQMAELNQIRNQLETWLDDNDETINQAMLFRLNELMEMAAEEKRLLNELAKMVEERQPYKLQDMSCAKWRSKLAYTVARNAAKRAEKEGNQKKIEMVAAQLTRYIDKHHGQLKIPVWQILYDRR